ncbi:DUF2859 domain-containing protein [Pseudomonas oryzihabitans]|uniref:DUF2859 domain-containing protein n=1 Tax=Pseudomonas oryzihabitans TaxID=47885 RepID=UPI002894076C|nr:DUF2859 domain-containing protein [Pseudomonas oryzihabitans]MDT3723101.1 DUF2859 domain-containing protein [Pseudomonas oryzihabitans]
MIAAADARHGPGSCAQRTWPAALFLFGDDELARQWLASRGETLKRLGAVGLAVNVASAERLAVIRRWTGGLAV